MNRTLLQRRRGAAFVVTLLLLCLLSLLVLGYFSLVVSDRHVARGEAQQARTSLLLDTALAEVRAKIQTAYDAELPEGAAHWQASVTASPGLLEVRRYDVPYHRGAATGAAAFAPDGPMRAPFAASYDQQPANPRWIPLFSWQQFAPQVPNLTRSGSRVLDANPDFNAAAAFNLNTTRNPFHPGYCYLSGVGGDPAAVRYERVVSSSGGTRTDEWAAANSQERFSMLPGESAEEKPVWVQWVPVLANPALPPGPDNRMVGRYAYWVDVENTKLRLDGASRPLRESEVFGRFLGEADAVLGNGGFFEQREANAARQVRVAAEALVPSWRKPDRGTLDGRTGPGFPAGIASDVLTSWLGWRDGRRPAAADTSLVDWDFFTALRARSAREVALDSIAQQHASGVEHGLRAPFAHPLEFASMLDPKIRIPGETSSASATALLRAVATASATAWGHDDERDPLGRAKLDLLKFQREITGNWSGVSAARIQNSELWRRLRDPGYYRAYFPGAYPSGGIDRSFTAGFNSFAGDGNPLNAANGEAAVLQMLANLGESALGPSTPPLIDRGLGIVGARSMPYVVELATRARSAWWLLPPEIREGPLPVGSEELSHLGHPLQWYATHVVIDLSAALVNPNPFETEPFDGELELDYEWDGAIEGAPPGGSLSAPLHGRYTVAPEPGKDPKRIRIVGDTVYFNLGVVPASALTSREGATALRIKGWRIKHRDVVWHEVPVALPGGGKPREWWAMAQEGENAGSPLDERSLAPYQAEADQFGYRAVGWFTGRAPGMLMPGTLFVEGLGEGASSGASDAQKLDVWWRLTRKTALVERVFSLDPVVGHRTGDKQLQGLFGRGHFYGALGHTWRHIAQKEAYQPPKPGQTLFEEVPVKLQAADYQFRGRVDSSIPARRVNGIFYRSGEVKASYDAWNSVAGRTWEGSYYSHYWLYPTTGQEPVADTPDSPTGLMLVPSFEGPMPEGDFNADRLIDKDVDLGQGLKLANVDVETGLPQPGGDLIKLPDAKKSSRSFFTSAPLGQPMTSVGEIGFCHSGFPNRPIVTGPDEGRTSQQLNCPRLGPPMRMLLDLFTTPAFTDPDTGRLVEEGAWRAGSYTSPSPAHPRRGVWNVNTTVAHDGYMALREGGITAENDLKKEGEPARLPAHVVWLPGAAGHARRDDGAENFRGKELKHVLEKHPGHLLDRHLSPFPTLARPWEMWVGLLGGDFSPSRATGGQLWGLSNAARLYFGPGAFTWCPGRGLGQPTPYYTTPLVDFAPDSPTLGKLIAFGSDARKDDKLENDGLLRGRWAADQNLSALAPGRPFYLPPHHVTRLSLFPLRHFVSDLALDFHYSAEFADLKTPLNPRQSSYPPPLPATGSMDDRLAAISLAEGCGFPGGFHASGIYQQAPLALLTNQASTSANAFTAHLVVQTVRDFGKARPECPKSGPGYCDPDDEVLAERWARVVLACPPSASDAPAPRKFKVVSFEEAGR